MSSERGAPPTPVQIREANAHLAALHGRVAELERRLAAAEETVRGQARSLIRKDHELRAALQGLGHQKDREIAALEEKLLSSEEETQKLLGLLQDKDTLILHLKHRSRLLDKICRSRPVLDHLLAYMAEGEQLSPVPATQSKGSALDCDHLLETGCTCLGLDSKDFALDNDQESGKSVFGTTV
ncbi:vimentin-type intermediate filament-associated coiled-coil protein isoform X1 [Sphaerodactylus townsendi]|uniref:Uncharacterized protein n=1 Tax=Sphaerodactylus townsendi TaxID=933632 RepID=A0ACB8F266_9SAUR|nr:vimentin-type intermediate filament-associated coiled-coil protein isoform X1 [Sphaerodactylus townsendi]XP_048353358.1 vimentin-type intermediate filament-associated coiled-coil protein isoform X1 [Sphaerodactylus townsendi]